MPPPTPVFGRVRRASPNAPFDKTYDAAKLAARQTKRPYNPAEDFDLTDDLNRAIGQARNGVANVAALALLAGETGDRCTTLGVNAPGDGGGGTWYYDGADGTTPANTGTVVASADGRRWKRVVTGALNAKAFGMIGDGVSNDTIAFKNAIDAASAANAAIYIPAGIYMLDLNLSITKPISIEGQGAGSTILRCRQPADVTFGVWISVRASFTRFRNLTLDGNRAIHPEDLAKTALIFAKGNALDAAGNQTAGALRLAGNAVAGARNLSLVSAATGNGLNATALRAGEVLTLFQNGNWEDVRVRQSYTGGLIVPIDRPLRYTYAAATCIVTVAMTDCAVQDCEILGGGRDCVAFWHTSGARMLNNWVRDASDTAIDFPDAGCRDSVVSGNFVESTGRWCLCFDTESTEFGPTSVGTVVGNNFRFVDGGTDALGVTQDAVWLGNVQDFTVSSNTLDIRRAGRSCVRVDRDARNITISGNIMLGDTTYPPGRLMHYGIELSDAGARPSWTIITGNLMRDFHIGIQNDGQGQIVVTGNTLLNCRERGINVNSNPAQVHDITISGNQIVGDGVFAGGVGVRIVNPGAVGSFARVFGNTVKSFLFSRFDFGGTNNWVIQFDDAKPANPDTSGATLAALEAEVNELKATLRSVGLIG